ncbi:hypothetical protein I7I53_07077 [Histoplasma capsulatum var. duboisii H88]|uniref:Uncharacterized protein n=1 Tax=Ajellomyces capsulatus (strain H88) TaxID=544711 RepID=A0A8A1LBB6_AJEC8|nr:hypothetical protein I7I53_07077 [Histoplasma capsulatum var. duboisii H88]
MAWLTQRTLISTIETERFLAVWRLVFPNQHQATIIANLKEAVSVNTPWTKILSPSPTNSRPRKLQQI